MKRSASSLFLLFILCSALVSLLRINVAKAEPKTIVVPDDYLTIGWAIGNSSEGDTIFVKKGTYYEHVTINKSISLIGKDTSTTIIDGNFIGNVVNVTTNNVEINGFTIENSGTRVVAGEPTGIGIYVKMNTGSNIRGNVIRNNFEGVVFESCSNSLICENQIVDNFGDCGVRIAYSSSATLSKNIITSNMIQGVVVFHCSNSTVSGNQIVLNGYGGVVLGVGAVVSNSRGITVSKNNITGNADGGLCLVGSHENSVFGNNIRSNRNGICLSTSTKNNIYENTIQANYHSIAFYFSSGNCFYHNNFMDNFEQTYVASTNVWDDGYPSGGNYWSDYNGTDSNGDGIGDTPYVINENNQDNYPLIEPATIPEFPSWTPMLLLLAVLTVASVIYKRRLLKTAILL